jgi:hypothetical protein
MRDFFILVLLFLFFISKGQEYDSIESQALISYEPEDPYNAQENNDFTVKVKNNIDFTYGSPMFVYKTFVNKFGNFESVNGDGNSEESGFVNLDYSGKIDFEITCNFCYDDPRTPNLYDSTDINSVIVRPLSKGIIAIIANDKKSISFSLNSLNHGSSYLSVEINGNRYRNIHILANNTFHQEPSNPNSVTSVAEMNCNLQPIPGSNNGSDLAYFPQDGENIYIGGGEVFNGGIYINGVSNVTITGRGIIEHTTLGEKRYTYSSSSNYEPLRGISIIDSSHITVNGIIISDSNENSIRVINSNQINIKNTKTFSRVLWGASIRLDVVDQVEIENCFFRSSDDSIAIYPGTHYGWGSITGDATNVTIKNTALYADKAHAILIGREGASDPDNIQKVQNIVFENIDILEHEQIEGIYNGAIAVKCAEFNTCKDIFFRNVSVEDFSRGSLLSVVVDDNNNETDTLGFRTQNIRFDGLYYNTSINQIEYNSVIEGISYCNYVNGVHFSDFIIDGNTVLEAEDFDMLEIGDFAYDITFNQVLNNTFIDSGVYYIKNKFDGGYLNPTLEIFNSDSSRKHASIAPWKSKWLIEEQSNGVYTIKSMYNGKFLSQTEEDNFYENRCHGEFVITQPEIFGENINSQHWQFIELQNGRFRIENQWQGSKSLVRSSVPLSSNSNIEYVGSFPWGGWYIQQWDLEKIPSTIDKQEIIDLFPVPNPADKFFSVDFSKYPNKTISLKLYDRSTRLLLSETSNNIIKTIDTSSIENGIYILHIIVDKNIIKKLITIKH